MLKKIFYDLDLNTKILEYCACCPKCYSNLLLIDKKSNEMLKKNKDYYKYKIQSIKVSYIILNENYNYYKNRFQNLQSGIELALNSNYLVYSSDEEFDFPDISSFTDTDNSEEETNELESN